MSWLEFVRVGGNIPTGWTAADFPAGEGLHPVCGVSYEDATSFAEWFSGVMGIATRLPTEHEWEVAARGLDGRQYPWGDGFEPSRANTHEGRRENTTPVSTFQAGASIWGAMDMAGNVEEWTSSTYGPYRGGTPIHDDFGGPGDYRVTRGGRFYSGADLARCARRHGAQPGARLGFRLVIEVER